MAKLKKRLLIVANWDWVLYNFRLPLARAMEDAGLDVILVCPEGEYVHEIKAQGFQWHEWKLSRRSTNPLQELMAIVRLFRIYRELQPDVVHHFTIKPNFYGSLAARLACVPNVINNFTGLGYLFTNVNQANSLRRLVVPLMRFALNRKGFHTAFQSDVDRAALLNLKLVRKEKTTVIPGTGVDLNQFFPVQDKPSTPIVFMAGRLLWDKGVGEFVQAAEYIKNKKEIRAAFWLAGSPDEGNPAFISNEQIENWKRDGAVEFLGHRSDMPNLLQQAAIAVLPSYHEGVPLFLLEAAASGLPLVGSDINGCRMVIKDGVNGKIVPGQDGMALAEALILLLKEPDIRNQMGAESRKIAERCFAREIILEQYKLLYQNLGIL